MPAKAGIQPPGKSKRRYQALNLLLLYIDELAPHGEMLACAGMTSH
jgi:hypothetical protein